MKRQPPELDLFLRHRAALVDYATPIVGDRMRAEDVVQEAYLRFVPAADRTEAVIEQPVAYLYRIVRNLALDWTRHRAVEQRQEAAEPVWWMLPEVPRTPEQEMLYRDDLAQLGAGLQQLSPQARLAVRMHRFDGHTLAEIAARLGVSVPTAHRLVRDALVTLARGMDADDGGSEG